MHSSLNLVIRFCKSLIISKINYPKNINDLLDFSILISSIGLMFIFLPISHKGLRFLSASLKIFFSGYHYFQGLSFLLLLYILIRFGLIEFIKIKLLTILKKKPKKTKHIMDSFKKKQVVLVFCLFIIISSVIGCDFLRGNYFAKWAFARENIETPTKDPEIIETLKDIFENNLENNSTPSGFVLRQWLILLFSLYILGRKKIHEEIKVKYFGKGTYVLFKGFFIFSFVYILLARLILEQHTLVDIVVAISLGTIIYFLVVFIIAIIFKKNIGKSLLNRFTIFCAYSFLMFLIISKNPIIFLYMGSIFIFVIIPALYIFSRDDWGTDAWI